MTMMNAPGDLVSLVGEFAEPIPRSLRDRFFTRVAALLRDDGENPSPGRVMSICQKVQCELMIAPAIDEPATVRPAKPQPPRGPFRRRA